MSKNSGGSAAAAATSGGVAGNGGYMTYFDYHGIEAGAYYGVPYRQVSLIKILFDPYGWSNPVGYYCSDFCPSKLADHLKFNPVHEGSEGTGY